MCCISTMLHHSANDGQLPPPPRLLILVQREWERWQEAALTEVQSVTARLGGGLEWTRVRLGLTESSGGADT